MKRVRSNSSREITSHNLGDLFVKLLVEAFLLHVSTRDINVHYNTSIVIAGIIVLYKGKWQCLVLSGGTRVTPLHLHYSFALHDCHAEVLSRRGLIRLLLDNVSLLNDIREAHLVISQLPCGDATLSEIPNANSLPCGAPAIERIFNTEKELKEGIEPHLNTSTPFQKCIDAEHKVSVHGNEVDGRTAGILRVKPGKGNPTLCMSCSDKILKWSFMGLTGSAAGTVLPRISLASVTIATDSVTALENVRRSLMRLGTTSCMVYGCSAKRAAAMTHALRSNVSVHNGNPFVWLWPCHSHQFKEIIINGRTGTRFGSTRKSPPKIQQSLLDRSSISSSILPRLSSTSSIITYNDLKHSNMEYQRLLKVFKKHPKMRHWVVKTQMEF